MTPFEPPSNIYKKTKSWEDGSIFSMSKIVLDLVNANKFIHEKIKTLMEEMNQE